MAILISEPPGNLFRTRTLRVGQSYRLTFDKADTLLKTGTWTVTQRYHPSQRALDEKTDLPKFAG